MAVCWLAFLAILRDWTGFVLPFAEAGGYIFLGVGVWYLVTGRSFAQGDKNLPKWWIGGCIASVALSVVAGFFLRR